MRKIPTCLSDMKTCFKCNKSKELSEFYKHSEMGDGHLGKCKECTKKDVADRIARKQCDLDWQIQERNRCREKTARARSSGKSPSIHSIREGAKRWEAKNRHKKHAHSMVGHAIRSGKLIKQPCERCGEKNVQAHHEDYTKPLDVLWLCTKHHGERHVQINEEKLRQKLTQSK